MDIIISVVLILLALFFVWRVLKFTKWFQLKPEPPDEVRPGDVNVREPRPRRPVLQSGAVALDEPDEDTGINAYSRK